jgi:glutaredoxin-related protein
MESENYKQIEKMRAEMNEFRNNLKEELDNSQNPLINTARSATDVVFMESNCARAIKEMKKFDPNFDIIELHYEF